MADYIKVASDTRHGALLRDSINYQGESLERITSLKAVMDEMIDGADYTVVETEFGLQAGEGILVYNLLSGALAAIGVSAVTQLLARIG